MIEYFLKSQPHITHTIWFVVKMFMSKTHIGRNIDGKRLDVLIIFCFHLLINYHRNSNLNLTIFPSSHFLFDAWLISSASQVYYFRRTFSADWLNFNIDSIYLYGICFFCYSLDRFRSIGWSTQMCVNRLTWKAHHVVTKTSFANGIRELLGMESRSGKEKERKGETKSHESFC